MLRKKFFSLQIIPVCAFLSPVLFLGGCNFKIEKIDTGVNQGLHQNELSFAVVYKEVFAPRCVTCHGHSGGVSCETYYAVKSRILDIERVAIKERTMPKRAPLTFVEMDLLARWISKGASENPEIPVKPEEPLKPTFDSIKKKIFVPQCITCHSQGHPGSLVPLETKEGLIDSPRDLVLPGNPEESGLLIALTRKDDKKMPPPPTLSLPNEQIAVIHQWILEGAN